MKRPKSLDFVTWYKKECELLETKAIAAYKRGEIDVDKLLAITKSIRRMAILHMN